MDDIKFYNCIDFLLQIGLNRSRNPWFFIYIVQKGKGSYKGNRASVAGILAVIKVVFWENVPHGNTMRNSQDFG